MVTRFDKTQIFLEARQLEEKICLTFQTTCAPAKDKNDERLRSYYSAG